MKEFIDKLIERLEERKFGCLAHRQFIPQVVKLDDVISIVNKLAQEYNDGWIPCSGCEDCQHKECEHHGKV